MTTKTPSSARDAFPGRAPQEGAAPVDHEHARVVARPDGYYWMTDDGRHQSGPFLTALEARMALLAGRGADREPRSLADAESDPGAVETKAIHDRGPGA